MVYEKDKYELIDGHGKTVIFSSKQNEFVCIVGAFKVSPLPHS